MPPRTADNSVQDCFYDTGNFRRRFAPMNSATEAVSPVAGPARQLLRHMLATLACRGSKVLRDAPDAFSSCTCGGGCRSAGAILAHIGDLLDWALSAATGKQAWHDTSPSSWS